MIRDISRQTEQPEVKELLGYAVFADDEVALAAAASIYESGAARLYGYEEDGILVGAIGVEEHAEDREIVIKHIAVVPENRGKGYGRGLVLDMLLELPHQPERVIAETDEEAVQFYRNIGFEVYSLGELYPGVERFRCVYEVEQHED
ncbi:GNAT family N-acetyltransferase [Paenibacillus sp. JCM 10914]|uniref:GNAT family N-acetyltransferase n=1 Tax=Paenibacillus sp. JCM 10914 TaxID=1236974 RepID=UPI0003CC3F92|nr:GNAT family N-acetyltransferase [Paenibacillus sp. JCM 10914]GAE08560.1 acetyltransferase, GNAT family protein [Paenibacillus sp. JCM 10914]